MSFNLELPALIAASYKFSGLRHRLELLQSDKVIFNDSKSTTVQASLAACRAVTSAFDRKIILMLGGQEKKDSDWRSLNIFIRAHRDKFQKVVCFGSSAVRIAEQLDVEKIVFNNLDDAIKSVRQDLNENNLILFSPACASFDEFKNFEDRGDYFKSRMLTGLN